MSFQNSFFRQNKKSESNELETIIYWRRTLKKRQFCSLPTLPICYLEHFSINHVIERYVPIKKFQDSNNIIIIHFHLPNFRRKFLFWLSFPIYNFHHFHLSLHCWNTLSYHNVQLFHIMWMKFRFVRSQLLQTYY